MCNGWTNKCSESGGGRVTVYDWLRVIATIYVVIGHSAYLSISTTYGGVDYTLPDNLNIAYNSCLLTWLRWMSGWVYGFHMPLFFMLSGSVMALKPMETFDKVFRGKIKRLLIPYFVYGWLFMFPIKRIGLFYNNSSLKEAMKGFLSGQDSGHLWFLTALFWCIIVFVLFSKVMERLKIKSIYSLLIIAGITQLLYSYVPFDVLGFKTGMSYIFYFALGYVFQSERQNNQSWNMRIKVPMGIILLGIELINKKYGVLSIFFTIIVGSFLTYVFADILDCCLKNITNTRGWKFLIRNIFYVYIFHDPLNYVVLRLFMSNNLLVTSSGCYAFAFCRTVLLFMISLLMGEAIGIIKDKGYLFLNRNKEIVKD